MGMIQIWSYLFLPKKLDETTTNESFRVRVSIIIEQYDEKKIISKSFVVKKVQSNECSVSNYMLEGIEENRLVKEVRLTENIYLIEFFLFRLDDIPCSKERQNMTSLKTRGL